MHNLLSESTTDHLGSQIVAGRQPQEQILTTRVGLQFPTTLTYERWAEAGAKLSGLVSTFAWCLGDWLVYGKDKYESRYLEAVESVGLDYQTLRNYAWVARRFDVSRRREGLSFQHHAEVAALPSAEQDTWLDRAEHHGWSKGKLRQQIREASDAEQPARSTGSVLPRFQVGEDRLQSWHVAATRTGTDLASWIVTTLDREAAQALHSEVAD